MYEQELEIPSTNKLEKTKKSEWKQRRGEDIDTHWYDELNTLNEIINKYIIEDITSTYPPFKKTLRWQRFDKNNNLIEERFKRF